MVSVERAGEAEIRCSVLQRLQPSELRPAEHRAFRYSGKAFHTNWFRCPYVLDLASNWSARSWIGRRQQPADDRVSGANRVLSRCLPKSAYGELSVLGVPRASIRKRCENRAARG